MLRVLTCLLGCALLACETPTPPPKCSGSPCDPLCAQAPSGPLHPFTIAVLPDTQFYAERYPEIFQGQVQWLAQERAAGDLELVVHEGDIVNHNLPEQWDVASMALHALDGVVPYVLATGNHDLVPGMFGLTREADYFNEHFPVAMHSGEPWFCGTYEPDDQQNSYSVIEAGGRRWLVLALEFGPRDEVLSWANDILSDFAPLPAILVTHAYMYVGDRRYDQTDMTQQFSPHGYGIGPDVNDGEEMWQALVAPNPNVALVLSGHMLWPGVGRLRSVRADGSVTHQLLANYQMCPTADPCMHPDTGDMFRGGNGFLRLLELDASHAHASVRTYSPTLDEAKTDPDNEFEIDLTLP